MGAFGCGSSSDPSANGPGDPPTPRTELFVRRGAAGLEVVEVDLASGTATAVAEALPNTTSANAKVNQLSRVGERLIAQTSLAPTAGSSTYATFALDRATRSWRDLGVTSYSAPSSRDLGIIVERGPQSQELPNNVKVVTYDGRTLFTAKGAAGQDTRYPRFEALSPTGSWIAIRSSAAAVDVREIAADGTLGPVRQFASQEPPDTYTHTIACALPTTMVVEKAYPSTTWLDLGLAPVASPAFLGQFGALPNDLQEDGVCRYQVSEGDVHDVYAFDDRALTKKFSFSGKNTRLITVGDGVHLRTAEGPSPAFATLAHNDGPVIATYAPLPGASGTSAGGVLGGSVRTLATSLSTPSTTKAAVFAVEHHSSEGDFERTLDIGEELFIVDADGTARPTVRLRAETDPKAPNAAGFVIPRYRFTRDGSKLVYVLGERIHVRAIDGDATTDRVIDGTGFVDAPVRDGSAP